MSRRERVVVSRAVSQHRATNESERVKTHILAATLRNARSPGDEAIE